MRIRKRKVPLPLSSLSPIPLSDPHLFSRSPVMVVKGGVATNTATSVSDDTSIVTSINSQPSDHLTLTCPYASASDLRRPIFVGHRSNMGVGEGDEGVVLPTSNDDASNANITTPTRGGAAPAVDDNNNNGSLLSFPNNAGRWCDGDKAIPLKKRRGSFNTFVEDNNNSGTTTITTTTPMMMKIDVKNGVINDDDGDWKKPTIRINNNNNNGSTDEVVIVSNAKKGSSKRGNTIMEGSRCSRVNGRGWRCCQPTLVGYSLCEHHLGKGRLRSMTSGDNSSSNSSVKAAKKKSNSSNAISDSSLPLGGRDERNPERVDKYDDDEKKNTRSISSFGNNKRVKLGVVKARSLSSLLGQTNTMGDLVSTDHHGNDIDKL